MLIMGESLLSFVIRRKTETRSIASLFFMPSPYIFGATMQFLYPSFLWALTALSIPIILHLFYFRRYKKVYFSNLRFLREVKEETSARNRDRKSTRLNSSHL